MGSLDESGALNASCNSLLRAIELGRLFLPSLHRRECQGSVLLLGKVIGGSEVSSILSAFLLWSHELTFLVVQRSSSIRHSFGALCLFSTPNSGSLLRILLFRPHTPCNHLLGSTILACDQHSRFVGKAMGYSHTLGIILPRYTKPMNIHN